MAGLGKFWNEGAAALLRNTLEEKGLSVERLAGELGVTPRTVRNWLRTSEPPTHPSVHLFPALCSAVGVPIDAFREAAKAHASAGDGGDGLKVPARPRRRVVTATTAVTATAMVVTMASTLWLVGRYRAGDPHPAAISYSIPSSDDNYEEAWAGRVSPDGRHVAFMAVPRERRELTERERPARQLFYLSTERQGAAIPVAGTEGAFTTFFWDDASRGLYFIRSQKLMYVAIAGGPAKTVAEGVPGGTHGDANAEGEVVLGSREGLLFVSPNGRVQLRRSAPAVHLFPTFLPDGRRFLFIEQRRDVSGNAQRDLYVMSLRDRVPRLVERNVPSRVEYSEGHLLYVRDCALLARPFDAETGRLGAAELEIKGDVWMEDVSGSASFSTSRNRVLVTHAPPSVSPVQEVRVTTRGVVAGSLAMPDVKSIAAARGGEDVVVARADRCKQTQTLWTWRPASGASHCLTCGRSSSSSPLLPRDRSRLYYAATRGNVAGIYVMAPERPRDEHLVFASPHFPAPRDLTPDGAELVIQMTVNRDGNLYTVPVRGAARPTPLVVTPEMEGEAARFSPDGQWLAFSAVRDSGGGVFLLRAGRPPSEARLVGPRGWRCRWSADGTKLYYAAGHALVEYDLVRESTKTLSTHHADVTEIAVVADDTFYVVTTAESHNRVDRDWTRALTVRP